MPKRSPLPEPTTFEDDGRRIAYRELGSGPRVIVLVHGLLMDVRMFTKLGPMLAAAGNRVLLCDMLGHGASHQPHDMADYSMPQFGRDVIALLDHLGVDQAVVGGTSLGANVALEAAVHAPERVRALLVEMPVLESGIAAAGAVFVPLALALRVNPVGMGFMAAMARLVPRTHWVIDMGLDTLRRDPRASLAVLDGLTFGRIAPPREVRRALRQPALIIGHAADPIHPFADAGKLAEEMVRGRLVTARSAAEWRVMPKRLDAELCAFLDTVWSQPQSVAKAAS